MWRRTTPAAVTAIATLVIASCATVAAQQWIEPAFIDAQTDGIRLVSAEGLSMTEEIAWPFRLVEINYDGPAIPYVSRTDTITTANLQLRFVRTAPTWTVWVDNRQDYENPDQQHYDLDISIAGVAGATRRLIIVTVNIFDNEPRLSYEGPCVVEELSAPVDTGCRFTVRHTDGILNNPFVLSVEGRYDETRKFGFSEPLDSELLDKYTREYTLIVKEELRFEERAMYNFRTTVQDVAGKTSTIVTLLQVIDMPSMPPQWTQPFATARFIEKSAQQFRVQAVDGDTDINKPIWYELAFLENQDYSAMIAIGQTTGDIVVQPIDRDALKQEIFPFNIVAYKSDNRSWSIEGSAVLVVDDLNDNLPVVTVSDTTLRILEETPLTLPIKDLIVNDIDLGVHATYTVTLEVRSPDGLTQLAVPFVVIPENGYQESRLTITVADARQLDFELPEWQQGFTVTVVATEHFDDTHIGRREFNVELLNWNDELPIFASDVYKIEVKETIGADEDLITITATDRDIDDTVIHSIVGLSDLSIEPTTGAIRTAKADTFDYDRQRLVIVQIQAQDQLQANGITALHTAYTQLQITVLDVNNKTPEMRMPRNSPRMDENEQAPYSVTTDPIVVTDPDTTADLRFTIDWQQTYATKAGQDAAKQLYENCFLIEADTTNPNRVLGHVVVNPDFFPRLIDYEEYEVIYLHINVRDHEQTVGEGSADAVLTIRINDLNDNRPLFILDTLQTVRSVIEEAVADTLVGTIFAVDIDGPEFNKITYSIEPFDAATPADWITIDPQNGELRVAAGAQIGCDQPIIYNLRYSVSLYDGLWTTTDQIDIHIQDINNKDPQFGVFARTVQRYENITTGELIQTIVATDLDRDAPNNRLQFAINFADTTQQLDQYFAIDIERGVLSARLQGTAVFDRDRGFKLFDIPIIVRDNYQGNGRVNLNTVVVRLTLLDVNDNAPEMPADDAFQPRVAENAKSDSRTVLAIVRAPDIDDETTPNARVGYAIRSIRALAETAQPVPDGAATLLQIDAVTGDLRLGRDAEGFYGRWTLAVEAFDHGHEWTTHLQLRSLVEYTLTVEPFNFHAPVVAEPASDGVLYRLDFYAQKVSTPLMLIDGATPLPPLRAIDPDGGEFGDCRFEITSTHPDRNDADYFTVFRVDAKSSQLYLQRPVEARFYHLNVRAIDGGQRTSEWTANLTLVFVDMSGEPVFELSEWETDFTENVTGLEERRLLPAANDPKNVGVTDPAQMAAVYYFIDPDYRPDDARLFRLDAVSRQLSLSQQLDREHIHRHIFRVVTTNRQTYPTNPQPTAFITVNVTVNDVNDNPPRFEYRSYGSGITQADAIGKHVLTVHADDPDLDDVVTYAVEAGSYVPSHASLRAIVENNPFELNAETGELRLNFAVAAEMRGHIEFRIKAFDLVMHEDVCDVKIYIIADTNLVTFMFLNPKAFVDQQRERIGQIFGELYGHECYIDDITKSEVQNVAQDNMSTMRAHFIDNNEAVEAADIFSRSNDVILIGQLRQRLLDIGINLIDVPTPQSVKDDAEQSAVAVLQTILIALTCVLGSIITALIVFFTLRERSLTRQLRVLSMPAYEKEKDLSAGPNAFPAVSGRDMFGFGGSSPSAADVSTTTATGGDGADLHNNLDVVRTCNKDKDMSLFASASADNPNVMVFDNLSLISGTSSDFIGIEDDPTFVYRGFNAMGANTAVINGIAAGQQQRFNAREDNDNVTDDHMERKSSM